MLALPAALSLGITLARPAHAATTISTTKTSTVNLQNSTNYPNGNPFSITSNTDVTVSGGNAIYGDTTAFWTLTNAGSVTASGALHNGVFFKNGGTINNIATISSGYGGILMSGTAGTVSNSGTITGTNFGINLQAGGTVNSTSGSIGGGTVGVEIGSIAGTVFNGGTITETSTGSSYAAVKLLGGYVSNSDSIVGFANGIISQGTNALTVQNAGLIQGIGQDFPEVNAAGIILGAGGGAITNSASTASILGYNNFAIGSDYGTFSVFNAGTIATNDDAIYSLSKTFSSHGMYGAVSVTNTIGGSITGGNDAININTGAGTVTNQGLIAAEYNGIYLGAGGTITNATSNNGSGIISGGNDGIQSRYTFAAVNNYGSIFGQYNDGVDLRAGGTVSNNEWSTLDSEGAGGISGYVDGVYIGGTVGAVYNDGTIRGVSLNGVDLHNGGSVVNFGSINGAYSGVHIGYGFNSTLNAEGSVFNAGVILGTAQAGVILFSGGLVSNLGLIKSTGTSADGISMYTSNAFVLNGPTATIDGGRVGDGVRLNNGGSVVNFGTIKTGIDGVRGTGVYMYHGGDVNNFGSAAVIEGQYGVQSKGDGFASVDNTGLILGYRSGVDFQHGGVITNDNCDAGFDCENSFAGLGTISGNQMGINIAGTLGFVYNYGLVTGGLDGVNMQAGGMLVNNSSYGTPGVITGGSIGVRITGGSYASVFNGNGISDFAPGTISGGNIGVQLASEFNYVGNDATIIGGTAGVGVQFGFNTRQDSGNYGIYGTVNNSGLILAGSIGVALNGYDNFGSGSVENTGTIAALGTDGIGVYLYDGGFIHNDSTNAVIAGGQYGVESEDGYASVTNKGTISGGAYGVALFAGGNASNASTGTIIGNIGVGFGYHNNLNTYAGYIVNRGTIIGDIAGVALFGGGYVTNTGTIIGGRNGIYGGTIGTVNVLNSGLIIADSFGVNLYSSASVTNTGTIIAGNQGVYIGGTYAINAYVTNSSTGTITGGSYGVELEALTNTVVNSGSINGGNSGVYLGGAYATVGSVINNANATITGGTYYGVYLDAVSNTVVNRGSIHGGVYGIFVSYSYSSNAYVTNSTTGTITGGKVGVYLRAPSDTVLNSGFISGSQYDGVRLFGTSGVVSLVNDQTGTITGGEDGVIADGGTITYVENSGTIIGTTADGVETSGNSSHTTINNEKIGTISGTITGAEYGVYDESAYFTLDNSGLIQGTSHAGAYTYEEYGAFVTNESTGTITGYNGVDNDDNNTLSLYNSGLISGSDSGVYAHDGGTISNITNLSSGTITGGSYGIYSSKPQLSVDNSGFISGADQAGIEADGTNDTVINEQSGTIIGHVGIEGYSNNVFSLDNSGLIIGTGDDDDSNAGVYTDNNISDLTNEATGTISGVTNGVFDDSDVFTLTNHGLINSASYGVYLNYSGNVTNTGTIIGGEYGIYNSNQGTATITNSGTIIGSSDSGVLLQTGTLTNEESGVIEGGTLGVAAGDFATVTNAGLILDTPDNYHAGVLLYGSAASLINLSTGTISGYNGVTITGNDDSLFNAGTIIGTGGTAIKIADSVDPTQITLTTGSTLFGNIDGGGTDGQITLTGTNTMGNDIVNFGSGSALGIVQGADWTASGNWTIASVTNSGTFQPGVIGTPLNLTGNFVQGSMGTLRVVVTPSVTSQFNVTGTATVGGKLTYVFAPGYYQPTTLDFLTASGGVTADNLTVSYIGGVPAYLSHDTFIIASGTIPSYLVLGYVAPLDDTIFSDMNQEAATEALAANDSLLSKAGEGEAANPEACAAAEGVNQAGNAPGSTASKMATALGNAFCSAGGWIQATGEAASMNASNGAPSFNAAGGGFLAGIDKPVGSSGTRVGLAVGYDTTWLHDSADGKGSMDTTRVGLYGSQPIGSFTLAADFLYGYASNTTTRQTGIGGLGAKYSGNIYSGGVQISTGMAMNGFNIEPSAGAKFASVNTDSLNEGATGVLAAFAVKGASTSYTSIQPFVNVGISRSFLTGSSILVTPEASVGYTLDAGDRGKAVSLTIADGTTYLSGHSNPDSSAAQISAGIAAGKGNWSLYARYSAYVSGNWTAQTGEAGLQVRF